MQMVEILMMMAIVITHNGAGDDLNLRMRLVNLLPSNQVNLKSCCVVPEELSTFAKENRVRRFLKLICDWFCKTVTLKNEKSGDPAHPL